MRVTPISGSFVGLGRTVGPMTAGALSSVDGSVDGSGGGGGGGDSGGGGGGDSGGGGGDSGCVGGGPGGGDRSRWSEWAPVW